MGLKALKRGLAAAGLILGVASGLHAQTDEAAQWQIAQASGDIVQLQRFVHDHPQSPDLAAANALLAQSLAAARGLGLMPVEAVPDYPRQHDLMAAAGQTAAASDYQAYLAAYPQGLFAAMAKSQLALLALNPPPAAADPAAQLVGLTFTTPFPMGDYIQGRSIADLIAKGSPQYPPIEGLPEEVWKGKTCINCHAWTEANLCDQAKTYTKPEAADTLTTPHPLGVTFKIGLKAWALAGCK